MGCCCSNLSQEVDVIPEYIHQSPQSPEDINSLLAGIVNPSQNIYMAARTPAPLLQDINFGVINDENFDDDSTDSSIDDTEIAALLQESDDESGDE